MERLRQGSVTANGMRFATIEAGEGPLVLCLHGFPDNALTFKRQLPLLAGAGYYAVAPYMRGYAPTEIPADGVFQSAVLGLDTLALIEALGYEKAIIMGHDWGAVAAYAAALAAPEKLTRIITIALPYGTQVMNALLTDYDQLRRSWYIFFFQQPIAGAALAHDDYSMIERLWRDWSPGWDIPVEQLESVKQTFRNPGVAEAALAYYRQTLNVDLQRRELGQLQARLFVDPIEPPCLAIFGRDDGCLGVELLDGMEAFFPRGFKRAVLNEAGHFVHQEDVAGVNALVTEFLA